MENSQLLNIFVTFATIELESMEELVNNFVNNVTNLQDFLSPEITCLGNRDRGCIALLVSDVVLPAW